MSNHRTQSSLMINPNFNAQDSCSEASDSLFPDRDSDEEEFGLQRSLPSNKLSWDNVRKYSSIITSRPDVLSGLIKPPPATFFDQEEENAALMLGNNKRTIPQTTQHATTPLKPFGPPSTTLSPSSSGPIQQQQDNNLSPNFIPTSSSLPEPMPQQQQQQQSSQPPPKHTRRNSLRASTSAFINQQLETSSANAGPLSLLRQNSQPPQPSPQPDTSILPPPPPEEQTTALIASIPAQGIDNDDDEHDFVKKMLQTKQQATRRSSIGYELDLATAAALPPPPEETVPEPKTPPPATLKPTVVTPSTSINKPLHTQIDRRKRNLSRTEEDMMALYTQKPPTRQPQSSTPVKSQSGQVSKIDLDAVPQLPPQPHQEPLQLDLEHDTIIEENETQLLSPYPNQPVSSSSHEMYTLFKRCMGDVRDTPLNDPQNGIYNVPDVFSFVQLGVLLAFGQYSPDTFINDEQLPENNAPIPSTLVSSSKSTRLKLQPTTYNINKLLQNQYIQSDIITSPLYISFLNHINQRITHIPFEIPVDIHPRSFGVSLLLTAATAQVSLVATDLNHYYQQCAVFFLILALITQTGVLYSPHALVPYDQSPTSFVRCINNKNSSPDLDTPAQEDVLFYLSLLTDPIHYQKLYHLYTLHNPLTMQIQQQQEQMNDLNQKSVKTNAFTAYKIKSSEIAIGYSILPQIEHQAGLRLYQLASVVEGAYTAYHAHLNLLPHNQHHTVQSPPFLPQFSCFQVGYFLWLKAALQSYAPAISDTSWVRYSGSGLQRNYDLAFHWVYLAAGLGDQRAMNNLGLYYKKGIGSQQTDLARCYYWLQKAKVLGYPSLSAKTLQAVEKLLGLDPKTDAHNNPYLNPSYGQLPQGSHLTPLDTWDNWIVGCETFENDKYDVINETGLYTQKQRVDIQFQTTMSRLQQFPPLVQKQYNQNDIFYNAAIILAMIPRPIIRNIASGRRQSNASLRRNSLGGATPTNQVPPSPPLTPLPALPPLPPTPLDAHQLETPTPTPAQPLNTLGLSLPPLPPSQQPLPVTPVESSVPVIQTRPSIFQRKSSLATLRGPQTYTLSQQDILALQQQQQELQQETYFMMSAQQMQQSQINNSNTSSILKTPIKPNIGRILTSDITAHTGTIVEADESTQSLNITVSHVPQVPVLVNNNQPLAMPVYSRLESTSAIDPITAAKQQQTLAKEQSQQKYFQQDIIPPPPPPIESDQEEEAFTTVAELALLTTPKHSQSTSQKQFPKLIPITVHENKEASNSNGVTTFNPNTNSYVDNNISNTTPRHAQPLGSRRPSVVSVASPVPVPTSPVAPRQSISLLAAPTPQHQKQQQHQFAIPEEREISLSRHEYHPRPSSVLSNAGLSHTSTTAAGRRSVSYNQAPLPDYTTGRVSSNTIIINSQPIARSPTLSEADWQRLTKQHYRKTLASMMNLTRDGYIVRVDHLNQLAELRVAYGINAQQHQEEYHFCHTLFNDREKSENERYQLAVARKKTLNTMHKTMKLEMYEKELEEHKKKVAAESSATPRQHGNCLSCKNTVATQCILPCQHYCLCFNCATTKRIKTCLYCGGAVKSIDTDPGSKPTVTPAVK